MIIAEQITRFQINHKLLALLFCYLSGALATLAFAPYGYWPLALLSVVLWFSQVHQQSARRASQLSYAWGFGYFSFGISWVHVSIEQFGGMPLLASLFLMLLLCGYLAIYPALSGWLAAKLTGQNKVNLMVLAISWLVTEYLRSFVLTGFPWLSIGYSQIDSPFAALAPIMGEVGISVMVMLSCASLCLLIVKPKHKLAIISLVLIAVSLIVSPQFSFTQSTGDSFTTALVQGNIKQELRWDDEAEQNIIDLYINNSSDLYKDHDVVIWPEAAIPRVEPLAQETLRYVNEQAHLNDSSLITGIINYNLENRQFYNSIIVMGNKSQGDDKGGYYFGNSNQYSKHHLLPIGEFVPFGDLLRPIAPFFNLPMSSFSRGDFVQTNLQANDIRLLPLICFEIVFPNQLSANLRDHTDAILTISNDAWFGDSHGPHQHLEIARMRALEFAKPVIRATNNGLTAVIDHHGQIIADVPQFTESILSTSVNKVSGQTLYGEYGKTLHKILVWLLILCFVARLWQLKRRSNKQNTENS
ncbi:apolipoprotein N-acyltransferase [Thalassotalea sp. Y01]|uniref:apolipoprotein N-acyltransferase n=1 Tax=Thalassotalea sp. Y01 TaxID=2729613 RepID=UPI00145F91FA|nr:apolipoprotein N-acyltransferase [Thalassotalea sp. Y01]NMP17628.1 apolipoprotein N-acyltransferase [Thalassotalea sp. Y01]